MSHECLPECVNWTGTKKCHCTGCGENFSVVTNFDKHRREPDADNNHCKSPASVGLVQNSRGTWIKPMEVE